MKRRVMWPALAGYVAGLATAGAIAMLMPAATPMATTEAPSSSPVQSSSMPAAQLAPQLASRTGPLVPASPAGDPQNVPQHSATPLSAEARGRIAPLEARLVADPGDFSARKQLAVILLQNQQLMAAYEHASQILAAAPGDPDGLYVHGVVRLAMGHAPQAIELLDRVLARYPDHALALEARAEAQRKLGDKSGAALTAARARAAAQGGAAPRSDDSAVDQLVAAASDGTLLKMMRSDSSDLATPAGGPPTPAADADAGGD